MTVNNSTCRCCNQAIMMIKSVGFKVAAKWTHNHSGLVKCGETYAQPIRQDTIHVVTQSTPYDGVHIVEVFASVQSALAKYDEVEWSCNGFLYTATFPDETVWHIVPQVLQA